jgi:hypothetical protein
VKRITFVQYLKVYWRSLPIVLLLIQLGALLVSVVVLETVLPGFGTAYYRVYFISFQWLLFLVAIFLFQPIFLYWLAWRLYDGFKNKRQQEGKRHVASI